MTSELGRRGQPRLQDILGRSRGHKIFMLFGPAFVASVAYIDPGNFVTNFAGGARYGYQLAWVIALANAVAMVVQYLTSKAGLATGRSLPELCRDRLGRRTNIVLWLQAELVAMATDLAEFVGAAIGLNLVFGVPPLAAGAITAVLSFAILAMEQRGYRRFELFIAGLLGVVTLGLGYVFIATGHQQYGHLSQGLIPRLSSSGELSLAVGIVGATVMPHVVYLHSALQKNRLPPANLSERRTLLRYNTWDCVIALGIAGIVNLSMLCTAAAVFRDDRTTSVGDLAVIHTHIAAVVGGGAALVFGIALMSSGLSSSCVGTYAGQIVMAGFVDWRIPLVLRRGLTMLPSLVVLGIGVNTGQVLVFSQIALSFGIPFALVPLLLVTRDAKVMGELVNRRLMNVIAAVITLAIAGLNLVLLVGAVRSL